MDLTPLGEHEEPSLEREAKRARFEVDLKVEAAKKRVGTAMEQEHGGELTELDVIGMASGQPPVRRKHSAEEVTLRRKRRRLKVDSRRGKKAKRRGRTPKRK